MHTDHCKIVVNLNVNWVCWWDCHIKACRNHFQTFPRSFSALFRGLKWWGGKKYCFTYSQQTRTFCPTPMLYWSTQLLMNAAITWKSSHASIFPKQHLFDILQKFLLGAFVQARETLQSCEVSLMLFGKKCRKQNGSQPVWFHRDNFIMQTQHRIYVGKFYRTLELLPASTI